MKYKLIKELKPYMSTKEQIAWNRGIDPLDYNAFISPRKEDDLGYTKLCGDKMYLAGVALQEAIDNKQKVGVLVDCDADGYLSSALLINYLYDVDKDWAKENIYYYIHPDKIHGLSDGIEYFKELRPDLLIIPDASSSEWKMHKELYDMGIKIIVLDHHEVKDEDFEASPAIIINNQIAKYGYENKDFCGAGVVYKFLKYFDYTNHTDYVNKYLDMVAVALISDMMNVRSLETRYYIIEGIKSLKNPFIAGMAKKNAFSIGDIITPMGIAFYITPFINAVTRSGTPEEQELIFKSMIVQEAYKLIPSTKRGCKGEFETVLDQALRTATNVKARQKRVQDKVTAYLDDIIETHHLDQNNAIVIVAPPEKLEKNLAGLCANQLMAKYRKPVCLMIDKNDKVAGSARGCDRAGVTNFKKVCEETEITEYCSGHSQAFGVCVAKESLPLFVDKLNSSLDWIDKEPCYDVDFIFTGEKFKGDTILDIASFEKFWGTGFPESKVAIEDLTITTSMISVFDKKSKTVKIDLPNGVSLIKFFATAEMIEELKNSPVFKITVVGTPKINRYMNKKTPQIFIEDYEIKPYVEEDFSSLIW